MRHPPGQMPQPIAMLVKSTQTSLSRVNFIISVLPLTSKRLLQGIKLRTVFVGVRGLPISRSRRSEFYQQPSPMETGVLNSPLAL